VKGTHFFKMTGSGNDFVILDGRSTAAEGWSAAQVKAICDRRTGVGADGLVILAPATPEAVRMTYWNSDGSRSALCGNAALCCSRMAVHLELVPPGEFCLLTDAGALRVKSSSAGDSAEINLPDFGVPRDVANLALGPGERWMSLAMVGVPHLVVRVNDVEVVDPASRGRSLRFEPRLGAEGANVNFVSPEESSRCWLIRTYERGVEGETLACGTGTVATAVALAARGEARLPLTLRSRGGLHLTVRGRLEEGRASDIWLQGQGRLLFHGVWEGF
jgi:diaminopimelate epimerase